jgi:uncharacterized membrane protein
MSQVNVLEPLSEDLENDPVRPDSQWPILAMILASAIAMFSLDCVRHYLMRSGAWDLGFFDQAIYLISRGQAPYSSMLKVHVIGDHGSLILYPMALFYLIWPNVHMLMIVQAIALSSGAWAIWKLGTDAGLKRGQALAVAGAYLMYPVILTASIFDFHPDAFVVPALLFAILAARRRRPVLFCICVAVALSSKEVMSLTVGAMGVWLLLFERRKFYGIVALVSGIVWLIVVVKVIVPYFGHGRPASGLPLFDYLGNSLAQIILNMIRHPLVVMKHIFVPASAIYLLPIVIPVIWGLHYKALWPLIGAVPAATVNMLSNMASQRSLFYHYSLPIVPFVFVAVIAALSMDLSWLKRGRTIIAWSLGLFVLAIIARGSRFQSKYAMDWKGMADTEYAISQVEPQSSLLTTFETVPHLSHRADIQFIGNAHPHAAVEHYDYVLINTSHSSLVGNDEDLANALAVARTPELFHQVYASGKVFLYKRNAPAPSFAMR